MSARPAPYLTDSVKAGLMKPRPWNRAARRLKRQGNSNSAIAKALGVEPSMMAHFFNPASLKKHRARRRAARVEIKSEPAALAYERERLRAGRALRWALDPEGEREKERIRRRRLMAVIRADPERYARFLEIKAASARWRRKKRSMIKANRIYRGAQAEHHAGA